MANKEGLTKEVREIMVKNGIYGITLSSGILPGGVNM